MSVNVVLNGVTYQIPESGETDWGQQVTSFLQAVGTSTLQKTGGSFTLTAEVDFGATFGIKTAYLKSRSANIATDGMIRLGKNDEIVWRDDANSADLYLRKNVNDILEFNAKQLIDADSVQTMDNKTLNSAVLVTPETDVITFDDQTTPTTPAAGFQKLYSKADKKLYTLTSDGNEQALAVGNASGINFVSNSDFEGNTVTPWITYADAAQSSPVDGTGGSPTITFTASSSSPLNNTYSAILSKPASNCQGQGVSIDCAIPLGYESKTTKVSFIYSASANFDYGDALNGADPSDVTAWAIDTTSGQVFGLQNNTLDGGGLFTGMFQTTESSTIRLCLHIGTTNALAWDLKIDDVKFEPSIASYGPAMTDWTSWTPTGTWVSNATYTGRFRRVGDSAEVQVNVALTGAPTATTLTVNLPFTIDQTKMIGTNPIIGSAAVRDSSPNARYIGSTYYVTGTNTSVTISAWEASAAFVTGNDVVNATTPITFANGDSIAFSFKVPVVGYGSNIQVNNGDGRAVVARASLSGASLSAGSYNTATIASMTIDNTSLRSGDTLVIKESGYYSISGLARQDDTFTAGEALTIAYSVNGGTEVDFGADSAAAAGTFLLAAAGNITAFFNAADVIRCRVFSNEAGTLHPSSFFQIEKTPIAGTLGAGSRVSLRANTSTTTISATGSPNTVISFSNTVENTAGASAWNGSVFTVPVAGEYCVVAQIQAGAVAGGAINNRVAMAVQIDGVDGAKIDRFTFQTTTAVVVELNGTLNLGWLNPGQTISIGANKSAAAGTVTLNGVANDTAIQIWKVN